MTKATILLNVYAIKQVVKLTHWTLLGIAPCKPMVEERIGEGESEKFVDTL